MKVMVVSDGRYFRETGLFAFELYQIRFDESNPNRIIYELFFEFVF
jgi:hypothetical protein